MQDYEDVGGHVLTRITYDLTGVFLTSKYSVLIDSIQFSYLVYGNVYAMKTTTNISFSTLFNSPYNRSELRVGESQVQSHNNTTLTPYKLSTHKNSGHVTVYKLHMTYAIYNTVFAGLTINVINLETDSSIYLLFIVSGSIKATIVVTFSVSTRMK